MRTKATEKIGALNTLIPVYCKEDIIISKENAVFSFEFKDHFVEKGNQITVDILEKCNGKNSVEEIITELLEEYDVGFGILRNDILSVLHEAWKKGIVHWKEKNPFSVIYINVLDTKGRTFKRIFAEDALQEILKIGDEGITNDLINKTSWYQKNHLNNLQRMGLEFYFEFVENESLKCLIAIAPEIMFCENSYQVISMKINYIYAKSITLSLFNEFLNWVVDFLYNVEDIEINPEYCSFQIEVKANRENDKILSELGMEKVTSILDSETNYYERKHFVQTKDSGLV